MVKYRELEKEEKVVDLLIRKGYHIAFAESCTAGKAVGRLVNVANASQALNVSFVTYADDAKVQYLGVSPETIQQYGVVSEEVAREMAAGVAATAKAEVGVGITGIAGPSGAVPGKPVGTVCFGISVNGEVTTWTKQFGDIGRNYVRRDSVEFCFDKLLELLEVEE
jgi:PncC family amidohydrolase